MAVTGQQSTYSPAPALSDVLPRRPREPPFSSSPASSPVSSSLPHRDTQPLTMVSTRHSSAQNSAIVPSSATRQSDIFVTISQSRSSRTHLSVPGLTLAHLTPPSPTASMVSQSPSPITPTEGCVAGPAIASSEPESDDCWNLIPYHIPWGPDYYEYHAGTLPGPDGKTCLFLRSPTPLKNRRTEKACNKCRERKAKCSGDQPACARCVSRGYICTYVQDTKRTKGPTLNRQRRREDISLSTSPPESTSDAWGTDSSSGFGSPASSYSPVLSPKPKCEEVDDYSFALAHGHYPPKHEHEVDHWAIHERENHLQWEASAAYSYGSTSSMSSQDAEVLELAPVDVYEFFQPSVEGAFAHTAPIAIPPTSPSLHAPRPVKCAPFTHLLSPVAVEADHGFEVVAEDHYMVEDPYVAHGYADLSTMDMVVDAPWDGPATFEYAEPVEYVDMLDSLQYPEDTVFAEPQHAYYEMLAQQQYEASCVGMYSHPYPEQPSYHGMYSMSVSV